MKNIIKNKMVGVLLGATIIVSSCSEDLLDLEPVDSLSSNSVFVNQQGANAAVLGMYSGLAGGNNLGFRMNVVGDIASNDVSHTGSFNTWRDLDLKNWDAVNGEIGSIWASAYNNINRANNIIQNVDGIDMAQALKDQYKGEALFVRALNHFNLTNYFGDVPLVLRATAAPIDESYFVSRDPKSTVLQRVQQDLTEAISLLPASYSSNNNTRHRATRGAAQALLARLYLYTGNYAEAAAAASSVISNTTYSLVSFENMVASKGTQEAIFELFFDANNQNPVTFWYGRDNGGRYEFGVTPSLWNAYQPGDLRRASSIREEAPGVFVNFKYRDNTTGTDGVHVIRLAEMYLIRAEARVRTGDFAGAAADLQVIRRRAFNDQTIVVTLPNDVEQAIDIILAERRLEFAFEGHRWHDLVRTGRAVTEFELPAFRTLLPIPLNARDVNPNLTQNPGY
ncbi:MULTISPECIES: RagB/SusD family nutrient uptake outer membrane protein [Algoriphagus]|uniref:RagB/SusD family nutrient uptake outer membrane protein n=1 Tax=Algoriphagus TaxID=246875 RepID=UPI00119F0B47|nr:MULTISPECIES: RagB/SusD family nutrient uptake outer membrane protein [Algoriphagus]QYH39567.1 RagB/SusD family nutrient uptake outer membrane protein [Algoriphagus sp. NBT04N3]